jgi:hypothetical protein
MGLASSQARMLLLVGRKSDLEYRGQMINQRRMNIAWQTERIAKEYTDAMSNMRLEVKVVDNAGVTQNQPITTFNLRAKGITAVYIADGREVVPDDPNVPDNSAKIKALYDAGLIKFVAYENNAAVPSKEINVTTDTRFNYTYDTADDAGFMLLMRSFPFRFGSFKILRCENRNLPAIVVICSLT